MWQEWSVATLIAAAIAATIAIFQIHRHNKTARVNRTIELHEQLTTVEIVRSREILSRKFYQGDRFTKPSFVQLTDSVETLSDHDTEQAGVDSPDMMYLDHYFRILWCFQRIKGALEKRTLDIGLSRELFTRHIVWWSTFSGHMDKDDTSLIRELDRIIPILERRPWYLLHMKSKSYMNFVHLIELEVSQEFASIAGDGQEPPTKSSPETQDV